MNDDEAPAFCEGVDISSRERVLRRATKAVPESEPFCEWLFFRHHALAVFDERLQGAGQGIACRFAKCIAAI